MHHDRPADDPLDYELCKRLQLNLQWLESQSSGEMKPINAATHAQVDLLQRRQSAQETQKSHPDPVFVLVAALGKVHVAHAGHHLAANFPEADDLDVVENVSRDDGEEVLDGGEADVEEASRKGHELARIADLAARGGERKVEGELLWHAVPVRGVAGLEAHGVGWAWSFVLVVGRLARERVVVLNGLHVVNFEGLLVDHIAEFRGQREKRAVTLLCLLRALDLSVGWALLCLACWKVCERNSLSK
jgi:hypothetical protein